MLQLAMKMTTQKYLDDSRILLAQARAELVTGEVRQASEKEWGAAAQIVNAVAEQRGWQHRGHRELFTAVDRLGTELGDPAVQRFFSVATALHVNFYEDWRSAEAVTVSLDDVARFIDLLHPLAGA